MSRGDVPVTLRKAVENELVSAKPTADATAVTEVSASCSSALARSIRRRT